MWCMQLLVMGQILTSIHTAWIAGQIVARHTREGEPRGITHKQEDAMVNMLSDGDPLVYVHWGAYESGKSRAASNARFRLQKMGKLVMLVEGDEFTHLNSAREWLRVSVGVPDDRKDDKFSLFLPPPGERRASLVIDHADSLVKMYGEKAVLEAVCELRIPVLMLFGSWEWALDMLKQSFVCRLLGDPGLGRWYWRDLDKVYASFPEEIRAKAKENEEEVRSCANLSGSPGVLQFEAYTGSKGSMHRAQLIHREWVNGVRALNGEDMQGVTGRFPDRDHVFHWDEF